MSKKFEKGKMVPVPSHSIIPERDIDKSPVLECVGLGVTFGGLKAVEDFDLTIGRTEIAGLIGPNGAGKTTVMLTLETGEETIYALDTQSGQMQEQQTHVLLEDGSALAETIYQPQIRGVAVLCDGGGDVRVAARITEMVGALLDLPSNRICVEQRKP